MAEPTTTSISNTTVSTNVTDALPSTVLVETPTEMVRPFLSFLMTIAKFSNRLSLPLLQVMDIDPSTLDAIEEEEDNEVQIDTINEESEHGHENEDCPNNDFCWTEADFIQQYTDMNDATRHRGVLSDSWKKIHELEGHTVEVENRTEGKVVWKVIKECIAD